jgi:hypothetical protein
MANQTQILEAARESLLVYGGLVYSAFEPGVRHIELLATELAKVERGETRNLAICMPPRHAKTTTTELFVAQYLGRHPERSVIYTCYGADLAERSGRHIRDFVSHPRHLAVFPNSRIRGDSNAVNRFDLMAGGSFLATGAQGPLTGCGANLIVVDDLIKDRAEARSPVMRRSIWEWFQYTLLTRAEPNAAIIAISTRWATTDFVGMLLEESSERWRLLSLPAIAEPPSLIGKLLGQQADPLGRTEGQALWPERWSLKLLEEKRAEVGSAAFAAMYQQRPQAESGGVFHREWFKRYREEPQFSRTIFSLDCAFKTGQANDFSVVAVIAEALEGFYVRLVSRGRWEYPKLQAHLEALAAIWKPSAVVIEDTAS